MAQWKQTRLRAFFFSLRFLSKPAIQEELATTITWEELNDWKNSFKHFFHSDMLSVVHPLDIPEGQVYSWENIPYRPTTHTKNQLDMFIPGPEVHPFPRNFQPVVLFVHGGSWRKGDRQYRFNLYKNIGVACARAGIVCGVISYRLSPEVCHPEHAQDVAAAFWWLVQNAKKYGGNPHRITLVGHSAGAHLITYLLSSPELIVSSRDLAYNSNGIVSSTSKLHESSIDQNQSAITEFLSRISGVVAISGIYNIPRLAKLAPLYGKSFAEHFRRDFIEPVFGCDEGNWLEASPSWRVKQWLSNHNREITDKDNHQLYISSKGASNFVFVHEKKICRMRVE